jgi:hypothetical protein
VDTIDLGGEKVQDFPGTVPYLAQPTCALNCTGGEVNEDTGGIASTLRAEFSLINGQKQITEVLETVIRKAVHERKQSKQASPLGS